ncbi:MAG TPA: DedA family protein [Candidatus Dormibacteraeota bacterium]|nr:DedA family protein [Candidatus Dormibacteraeota bacterium]
MTNLVQHYGYLAVFVVIALESLGIPLPGETTLITAALYAGATHQLNIEGVILAAIAGAIVGDNIGYLLGHWGGYRLLVRYGRYIRLDQAKVKVARHLFHRYGGRVVFFGRFVSILRAYAAFLAGVSRMPWRRFLVFNASGGIVWATLYGSAAYVFGHAVEQLSRPVAIVVGVFAAIIVVIGVIVVRQQERRLEVIAAKAFPEPLEGYPGGRPL